MSYRAIITAEDNKYQYWMAEVANSSFKKLQTSNKLVCVYGSEMPDQLSFPLSFETYATKSWSRWQTSYNQSLLYRGANKPFLFREYLKNNTITEDNILLLDADTFFVHDRHEVITDPNAVRTGWMGHMSPDCEIADFLIKRFAPKNKHLFSPAIGIYLMHRDAALSIAEHWCHWTEKLLHDQASWEKIQWPTEAWAYVIASAELGIRNIPENRGLQVFSTQNFDDPIMHFYYFPKIGSLDFRKCAYHPWSHVDVDRTKMGNHGEVAERRLNLFFDTLNDLAASKNNVLLGKNIDEHIAPPVNVVAKPAIEILTVKYPFAYIVDEHERSLGYVGLRGPFRDAKDEPTYQALRDAGFKFIGITSFLNFPEIESEPGDLRDYGIMCEGWCHCFRNPGAYLPPGVPYTLLSESDLKDPRAITNYQEAKNYDFIYTCFDGWWNEINKNWPLMKKCLPVLCDQMNLRGLLVGRLGTKDEPQHVNLEVTGKLPSHEFLKKIAQSRMLILPNERDASPRIIAEALCLDVPVVMNEDILGGWKYVNKKTGAFFTDEEDIGKAVRSVLTNQELEPRSWFIGNYGHIRSGMRLLNFIRQIDPNIRNAKLAKLSMQLPKV